MSDAEPRHAGVSRRRRIVRRVVVGLCVLAVIATVGVVVAYRQLEGNINAVQIDLGTDRPEQVEVEGPKEPLNVLVMGSDERSGSGIGGETPGLSDTTMLLHLSADRKRAYGVSLPRDLMVDRPDCTGKKGRTVPGAKTQFNAAYNVGGPGCTVRTVEAITNVRIDHFVVINFAGFKDMVDAVNGVKVCVPNEVNDDIGKIYLPAGTYKVNGQQALDYVRVRHGLGLENGDIGRMKRQQAFIASMIEKVVSRGTLANPVRLYNFLDAATSSLTTDRGFAQLRQLASLGSSLQDIGLDNIQFITVPNEPYTADTNRLQFAPEADALWRRIRFDRPLGPLAADAVVPGRKPGELPSDDATKNPSGSPSSASPSTSPSPTTTPDQAAARAAAEAERKRIAEEAGLCA
ncbi:LCP family protein [Nocardioides aurantiacus]|uniref:LytR family transcriptional attenuator n=1 Tax=Nocardioides aurantiacus TaxID=86796 RepID=A0A3N2CR43_9ACTN|nr:LCP family protein [Nocardioides aurantiacus]ROR90002.1 LytR family transcriptional attenuator [Nocardioides aurantiacus]